MAGYYITLHIESNNTDSECNQTTDEMKMQIVTSIYENTEFTPMQIVCITKLPYVSGKLIFKCLDKGLDNHINKLSRKKEK